MLCVRPGLGEPKAESAMDLGAWRLVRMGSVLMRITIIHAPVLQLPQPTQLKDTPPVQRAEIMLASHPKPSPSRTLAAMSAGRLRRLFLFSSKPFGLALLAHGNAIRLLRQLPFSCSVVGDKLDGNIAKYGYRQGL